MIGSLIIGGGLSRLSFDLIKVYEVREQYTENTNFLMGYLLPWQSYAVNTFLLAFFLHKKKRLGIFFVLIMQVFIYATTGFKSFLFAPLLVLLFHYAFSRKKLSVILPILTIGCILLVFYSLVSFNLKGDVVSGSIFVRRNFYVPAQINYLYYEYFQSHSFVKLSDSIFSFFLKDPYGNQNIFHVVSNYYYGREYGLNVGYIGNAYYNFGFIGILAFSMLMGYILKMLDSITRIIPTSIAVSSIIIPSMAFVNSGLLTVLLTHGFLFSCFILWLYGSSINNYSKKSNLFQHEKASA